MRPVSDQHCTLFRLPIFQGPATLYVIPLLAMGEMSEWRCSSQNELSKLRVLYYCTMYCTVVIFLTMLDDNGCNEESSSSSSSMLMMYRKILL